MDRVRRAINDFLGLAGSAAGSASDDLGLIREAFDQTAVGLTLVSLEGEFFLVNRAFCELSGFSREELVGNSCCLVSRPEDVEFDKASLGGACQGDAPPPVEKMLRRRDGSTVWVRRTPGLMRDSAGNPKFIICAYADLTEQRARDRALHSTNRFLSAIIETSPIAIYATDLEGMITLWNPAAERTFGFTRDQALGRRAPFVPEERREEARELRERVLAGQELTGLHLERVRADGTPIHVGGSAAPLRDEDNRIVGMLVMCSDVTEARRTEAAFKEQLHFTRALMDAIPNPVYFKDLEGRYRVYNRAWHELWGDGKDWVGKSVHDMFDEPIAAIHDERDRPLLAGQSSVQYEALMPTTGGRQREMLYNKVSFVDQEGKVAGLIGTITDVTGYKETERALEASEARFRVLTESGLDLISVLAADGAILYQSLALKNLLGYDPSETIGRNVFDLIHREEVEAARNAFMRIVETSHFREPLEFRIRHRDGQWRTFESLGTNCVDNPHIRGVVFNSRDVTDRKAIQQRIQHLAYHDNLTGLPNRGLLQDRLGHSIARAERSGRKVAVLFIDLDNFKNINDTLGHDVGDELLRQVSRRLSECVRAGDTIARQGGDEFIVLLDNLEDGRGASVVAQKILNSLRAAFSLGGTEQHVSGSVGIAVYPEDGRDAQTLMKNADTAMFHGKGIGKNTYQYFTAQMNIAVKRRMTLESALRRAVLQKDFVLHYQPEVNLDTGEIVAVESLVRWKTEDSGTVMPGDFIPLAEETGLINEIGEWVLREACRQNKEWQARGLAPRRIAVNLSARQFADKAFLDTVVRVLEDTKLDPKWLELEITESQVMRQTEGMILLLGRLSEMGVHLAIDDFGTGYSSLSYLKRLPIQKLKIDQSFIRDITVDPNDAAIVVAIINMARSLDLETIAEGVETAGQLALLREKGCRTGQGFYFSAPVSAESVYLLLRQNNLYSREASPAR
ncbi:MAG TPA: EAL domain-containing protein [Usitatibacteraceae bacterium]|nr:EAL domain-containing protein [Usitatibacteraceae bacterium]